VRKIVCRDFSSQQKENELYVQISDGRVSQDRCDEPGLLSRWLGPYGFCYATHLICGTMF
jgi:hypothetical protein